MNTTPTSQSAFFSSIPIGASETRRPSDVPPGRGSHLDMTVFAFIASAIDETEFVNEPVITTRLRMNLTMAKGLVQGLTNQIAMAEAAKGTMS